MSAQCISEKSIPGRKDSFTKHGLGDARMAGVCSGNLKEAIADGVEGAGIKRTGGQTWGRGNRGRSCRTL